MIHLLKRDSDFSFKDITDYIHFERCVEMCREIAETAIFCDDGEARDKFKVISFLLTATAEEALDLHIQVNRLLTRRKC